MTSYPEEYVLEAAAYLHRHVFIEPAVGIVTGSGLGGIVEEMENSVRIPYADIPHFPVSSIKGHAGEVVVGDFSGKPILALSGRVHYYEGFSLETVVFPIKVMASIGVRVVIVTNAAGGINATFSPGDIVVITGHMDLMRSISLHATPRLKATKTAYDPKLRKLAIRAAGEAGITVKKGVYAAMTGPSYETPAEIKALCIMGADMVGMSTVPEATEANRRGMKVLGLSFITNLAAGVGTHPISHQEVIEISHRTLPKFKTAIKQIVKHLDQAI